MNVIKNAYVDIPKVISLYQHLLALLFQEIEFQDLKEDVRLINLSEKYFYQFVIPFIEPLSMEWNTLDDEIIKIAYAHFLFCIHARFLDNLLDNDAEQWSKIESIFLSHTTYSKGRKILCEANHVWDKSAESLYKLMYQYDNSLNQMQQIEIKKLWQRCSSIILVPMIASTRLPEDYISHYKNYMNFMLLIHDLHDVLDDISKGKRTYVKDLFKKEDSFKLKTTEQIMTNVYQELEEIKTIISNENGKTLFFRRVFPQVAQIFLNAANR